MKMTEEEVRKFRDELVTGNTSTLKAIYLKFRKDILNYLRIKNPNENIEDIFNDSLLVLHNNIIAGKITEFSSIKSYLIGICNNLNRQVNQGKNKFENKIEEIRLHFTNINDNSTEDDDHLEKLKNISRLALKSLTIKCQEIISNFYLYQMNMVEIAERMNLSSSDVAKTQKSRCFKKLKEKVYELLKSKS